MPAINQANWTAVSLPHSDYYPVLMLICYFRIFFFRLNMQNFVYLNLANQGFLIREGNETRVSRGTNDWDLARDCSSLIQIRNAEQPLGESKEKLRRKHSARSQRFLE